MSDLIPIDSDLIMNGDRRFRARPDMQIVIWGNHIDVIDPKATLGISGCLQVRGGPYRYNVCKRLQVRRSLISAQTSRSPALVVAMIVIAAAIFTLDTITHLEIAVAVLYVTVVLIAVRILPLRGVLAISAGCIALTLLSAILSLDSFRETAGIVNSAISIAAIVVTTYLASKNHAASMALQEASTELARVNRVTTLGELTAAIAHEVNQPIAGAVTNAEAALTWLEKQPPNVEEVHQALDAVIMDGKRAGEIIARIREFIVRSPFRSRPVDINGVVAEVIALMRNEIERNHILLQISLENELPLVSGDPIQLQQVILNLVLNATEALTGDKKERRNIWIKTEMEKPGLIRVSIRDSGPGVHADELNKVFETFYTTKPTGTGIGLSICRSIIEAHGGKIWASSAPEGGVAFHFNLPAATNRPLPFV